MSAGLKLGRAIGALGAHTVNISIRAAVGAGQFGEDVVQGVSEGYAEKNAILAKKREIDLAERRRLIAEAIEQHKRALVPAPEPEPVPVPAEPRRRTARA